MFFEITLYFLADNGFNPKWNDENCEFIVANPQFALIRFIVQEEDVFGDPNFIGQATYAVSKIKVKHLEFIARTLKI